MFQQYVILFLFGILIPCVIVMLIFHFLCVHKNGSRVLFRQLKKHSFILMYLSMITVPGIISLVISPFQWGEPLVLLPKLSLITTCVVIFTHYQVWKNYPDPFSYPFLDQLRKVYPDTCKACITSTAKPGVDMVSDSALIFQISDSSVHIVVDMFYNHLVATDHEAVSSCAVHEDSEVTVVSFDTVAWDIRYRHTITYLTRNSTYIIDSKEI